MIRVIHKALAAVSTIWPLRCESSSKVKESYYEFSICFKSLNRSAEQVENEITVPVENILEKIGGIRSIYSQSAENIAKIFIECSQAENIEETIGKIKNEILLIQSLLPKDIPEPIVLYVKNSTEHDISDEKA